MEEQLSLTGKRWVWPEEPADRGDRVGSILARRGIISKEDQQRFLAPTLASLHEPRLMADMDAATERLLAAVQSGESITVWGDYDVDGVCATVVLVELLRQVGARVTYYIPDRRKEGYGLNATAIREVAQHACLMVSVDCGITAHEEIGLARELGVDFIVVDHHQVPDRLPPATACLNPHRRDCRYPCKDLCAAGVAFMFAGNVRRALREAGHFGSSEPDLRDLLDVVALATVADMVPLRDTNRVLVAAGLQRMALNRRVGLRALLEVANVNPQHVTATDLGFRVGPRINARGRVSHAAEAVELLLCREPSRARILAAALDAANRHRRDLERATVEAAALRVESEGIADAPALVLYDSTWHPGVVGLVATRLVSRFHRPAVVVGEGGKGSGRTFEGLDLYAAIEGAGEHLVRFGGHRAAAGITIDPNNVAAFRAAFGEQVRQQLGDPPFVPSLRPDLEVEAQVLSLDMVRQLSRLEPFGQANPEPLLVSRDLPVRDERVVGKSHLKLRLGDNRHAAIGFGLGGLAGRLPNRVDVAFRLGRNVYGGSTSLELRVEDLRASRDLAD